MRLRLNGKPYEIAPGATIADLLRGLDLGALRVAVAVNGEVAPRPQHDRRVLEEGDEVEVIHAVAGG